MLKRVFTVLALVSFFTFCSGSYVYAISEGPSQPEAMQFELVDTTDLVNLATGDFTYSLPLLNIPGPAGDYPLNLSYLPV